MTELRVNKASVLSHTATLSFLHGEEEHRRTAYEYGEAGALRFTVPRALGTVSADAVFYDESGRSEVAKTEAHFCGMRGAYDIYEAPLPTLDVGLYFFRMTLHTVIGTLYAYRSDDTVCFSDDGQTPPTFQLSVSDFSFPAPKDRLGGVIYHIFVDRFAKGSKTVPLREDAKLNPDWDHGIPEYPAYPGAYLENNVFFGGTLYGVAEKLDYIATLGVNMIYLSPVFEAYSNHKYDTGDYMKVDAMFGGDAALSYLIEEAKKRGIGILLDGVFNHTGADSRYFNRKGRYPTLGAYQSQKSPYYDWYEFQHFPDRYTAWWGIPILPRIHPDRPECRAFFTGKDGVVEHYADFGIAGFRLDVADELSDAFLTEIKATLAKKNADTVLYGEVWEDASDKIAYDVRKRYYLGRELDGVMNYPLRTGLLSYIKDGTSDALSYALLTVTANAPKRIADAQMNLLGTHDTERVLTVLGGVSGDGLPNEELARLRMSEEQRDLAKRRLKMAYTALATLPGIPSVYYGDEAGAEGYRDPFNRMPFPWGREDADLLAHYRTLGALRKKYAVYREGDLLLLHLDHNLLVFARSGRGGIFLTAVNRSDMPYVFSFPKKGRELFSDTRVENFTLAPMSSCIFKFRELSEFEISDQ